MTEIPEKAVEFQPDALEIKDQKLPFWARWGALASPIFMALVILWACLSKVDVIIEAKGKLISDKEKIVMKPFERAIIKRINVKIGDIVSPGQILISFDSTINRAEADRLKNELAALTAQFERLKAEFENKPYRPQGGSRSEKWQHAIYMQRQDIYREKIKYYDVMLERLSAARKGLEDNLKKQRERLNALKRIELMFKNLHEKKVASLKEVIQLSISRMEMESTVDSLENNLLELLHQREGMVSARSSYIKEWRNSLSEEMVKVERELSSTRKLYEKNERLISSIYLRAPCRAVVLEIASFSEGSAVREAEPLITLIPMDGKIELEAKIRPQDIGKVKVGSNARIKLNAYPFQKHGTLDGQIRNISEDTLQRQQNSTPEGSNFYYRARVTISGRLREVSPQFRFIPGMEAQVEIKAGKRRIIEYLIYPLVKALDETAREP